VWITASARGRKEDMKSIHITMGTAGLALALAAPALLLALMNNHYIGRILEIIGQLIEKLS